MANTAMPDVKLAPSPNPFRVAQQQLDEAAELLELDTAIHQLLRWPLRELHVTLPVRMDDGRTKIFHGFRVQYNDARGPTKGGIRFHAVHNAAQEHKVHNRLAAYLVAVSRVAEAVKLRGWVG